MKRFEFTTSKTRARSTSVSLLRGERLAWVIGVRGFRVAVARGTPTNAAAALVGVPAAINSR
jgi:hypothetical protein